MICSDNRAVAVAFDRSPFASSIPQASLYPVLEADSYKGFQVFLLPCDPLQSQLVVKNERGIVSTYAQESLVMSGVVNTLFVSFKD